MGDEKSTKDAKAPKVFNSYSWTSEEHKERVRGWADRLISDGVNVILDVYDLKEGQDKYAFMEKMVVDPEVTHVLCFCDKAYAEKADKRKAGVGTESQIISKEVYDKVDQSKFIPIICEFIDGQPSAPTFLKSRIFIDFSTAEKVNENWEQLIRLLHGKPRFQKPALGTAPTYIREDSAAPPTTHIRAKFENLKQALLLQRPSVPALRIEFLDACIRYSDALRTREEPDRTNFGQKIVDTCSKLTAVRDALVDWVLLESPLPSEDFAESLIQTLERLLEQRTRPDEVKSYRDDWWDSHKLFVYETFLYIVASLLKTGAHEVLHSIFTTNYLRPPSENLGNGNDFCTFGKFFSYSPAIGEALGAVEHGQTYISTAAELIRRQASRSDLPFVDLMQAELLIQLMAFATRTEWYPNTLHYSTYAPAFPFFVKAARRKDFEKLAKITGISDPEQLRITVKEGRQEAYQHYSFVHFRGPSFWTMMNLDKLGSIS